MKMAHETATFGNKCLLILLLIVIYSKSIVTETSNDPCEKYKKSDYFKEVCGTDGNTYVNKIYMRCLNLLDDKMVAVAHPGCCLPGEKIYQHNDTFFIYSPVCTPDGRTWSNIYALRCHNRIYNITNEQYTNGRCPDDKDEDPCAKNGFEKDGLNPVCGSNGLTYQNLAQIKCLRKYNPDLHVKHDGKCSVTKIIRLLEPDYENNGNKFSKTNQIYFCEMSKNHFEWNPVCGDDNVTYPNPYTFLCEKVKNDSELRIAFLGECDSDAHKDCIRAGINYGERMDGETIETVEFDEDDQVCGSDGITHENIYTLRCRAHYNKNLNFIHDRKCSGIKDSPCGAVPCEGSRYPICASNGVTYVSIEAMWCINHRNNLKLRLRHDGPCLDPHDKKHH